MSLPSARDSAYDQVPAAWRDDSMPTALPAREQPSSLLSLDGVHSLLSSNQQQGHTFASSFRYGHHLPGAQVNVAGEKASAGREGSGLTGLAVLHPPGDQQYESRPQQQSRHESSSGAASAATSREESGSSSPVTSSAMPSSPQPHTHRRYQSAIRSQAGSHWDSPDRAAVFNEGLAKEIHTSPYALPHMELQYASWNPEPARSFKPGPSGPLEGVFGNGQASSASQPDTCAERDAACRDGLSMPVRYELGQWETEVHVGQYSPSHMASHSTLHTPPQTYSDHGDFVHGQNGPFSDGGFPAHQSAHLAGDRPHENQQWNHAASAVGACCPSPFSSLHGSPKALANEDPLTHCEAQTSSHALDPTSRSSRGFDQPYSLQLDLYAGSSSIGQQGFSQGQSVHANRDDAGSDGDRQNDGSPRDGPEQAGYLSGGPARSSSSEMLGSSASGSGSGSGTDSGSEEAESSDNMEFALRYCLNCTAPASGTMCLVSILHSLLLIAGHLQSATTAGPVVEIALLLTAHDQQADPFLCVMGLNDFLCTNDSA